MSKYIVIVSKHDLEAEKYVEYVETEIELEADNALITASGCLKFTEARQLVRAFNTREWSEVRKKD